MMRRWICVQMMLFSFVTAICNAAEAGNVSSNVPGPTTTVGNWLGKPTFLLEGKPMTKPVFETYAPETELYKDFFEAGCSVYTFCTNTGYGFGPPTWVEPNKWDFSEMDARAHRILAADPNALIMPRIFITTPQWWLNANPTELLLTDDGNSVYNGRSWESAGSVKWREDMAAGLRIMLKHMQDSDYGDRIFGYLLTGMATEEWYHYVLNGPRLADYSKPNTQAFQKWLKEKYNSNENLQKAWNDPAITFDKAAVPSKTQRMGDSNKTFRMPEKDMNVIDYYLFFNDLIPDTSGYFAKVVKDVTGGKKVVGAFYGYMFEFTGDPEFGHNALAKYLQCPSLDFVMVTASYGDRFLGKGADYVRSPATSAALHGKLWNNDNDSVSFHYPEVMTRRIKYSHEQAEFEASRLGGTKNLQQSLWMYQRSAGFILGWGIFESIFDLHGGYYHDPNIVQGFKGIYKVFDESKKYQRTSVSQILVVSDELSCSYAGFRSSLLDDSLYHPQHNLTKIGAPYDSILTDDIALANMDQYKLVIFLNPYSLTDSQRKLIADKVLRKGKTVVWSYAPGLFNFNKTTVDGMEKLTGMKIVPTDRLEIPQIQLVETKNSLGKSLKDAGLSIIGPHLAYVQSTGAYEHGVADANQAPPLKCQLFYVDDPAATVLGTLPGSKEATFAVKKVNGWTSIYVISPNLPPAFYRNVAASAGVHIYSDTDDTTYINKSYLTLCAEKGGSKTIKLPGKFDVIDPFTDKVLYNNVTEFTSNFLPGQTLLIRLQEVK